MEKIKLDELQLKIMKVLWEKGDATVVDIKNALQSERSFAITTIGTILQRLHKRNVVSYRKQGRQYIYSPLITEADTKTSMVSNLVNQLFQGKSSVLVNHLLKDSEFKANELEALKALINQQIQKNKEDE